MNHQNGIQIPIFTSATHQQGNQTDADFIDFSDLLYDLTKDKDGTSSNAAPTAYNNNGITTTTTITPSSPQTNPMIALYRKEAIAAAALAKQYASAAASLAQQSSSSSQGGGGVAMTNNDMNNIQYPNMTRQLPSQSQGTPINEFQNQFMFQNNNISINNNNSNTGPMLTTQNISNAQSTNDNNIPNTTHHGMQQQAQPNWPNFLNTPPAFQSMFPDVQQQQQQQQHQQMQQQQQQHQGQPQLQQLRQPQDFNSMNHSDKRHKGMPAAMQAPPAALINQHIQQQQQQLQQHQQTQQQQHCIAGNNHKSASISDRLGFAVPNSQPTLTSITPSQSTLSVTQNFPRPSAYNGQSSTQTQGVQQQQQQQQQPSSINNIFMTTKNIISSPNIDMLLQNNATNNNTALSMMSDMDGDHNDLTKRRERNRVHAKQSRVRKKFFLESLQEQVNTLQAENSKLRMIVQEKMPQHAERILKECFSPSEVFSHAFTSTESSLLKEGIQIPDTNNNDPSNNNNNPEKKLHPFDQKLLTSLKIGQRSLILTDPKQQDNPICFASQGFYDLTGYPKDEVIGKNCRFLQGEGTSKRAQKIISVALESGSDVNVCILNYKKDGTPFWNQLFIGVLRDWNNHIVNCVSVCSYTFQFPFY